MKKINFEGGQWLSREEMKRVSGGFKDDDEKKYKCCPKGQPNSESCSICITVKKGYHAECDQGVVTTC